MERFSKEKTEIKKPPTYLFYLLGVVLLFLAGFGIYYFGYYQYLQKQLTNLTNQNLDINVNRTRVNINQTNLPNAQKIFIDSPKEDEVIGNPVIINGQAEVFEAMFNVRIKNANGEILGEAIATAKEGQTFSPYEVSLNYATSTTEFGLIEAFDYSAKDGGVQDLVSVKVKFGNFGQPSQDETADLPSKALAMEDWQTYRNEEYGFEFKHSKEWNIIDNKRESIPEGAPYVKIENKKDFKVRNFSIEIMLVNKEGAEMPAGMVFGESTKIVENKTTGEKMYFKIVANSCMGGICWRADQEEQAMKDTEFFSKHWESIINSIKPLE